METKLDRLSRVAATVTEHGLLVLGFRAGEAFYWPHATAEKHSDVDYAAMR